jgi:putative flavoprotein involved in K+ transport
VPRRYRGHDIIWWLRETRFFAQTPADLPDPAMLHAAQPQLAGTSPAHTTSYQHLARRGATIVGHSRGVQDGILLLEPNALECIEFADEGSEQIRTMIDEYIAESGLDVPPPEDDPGDNPDPDIPVSPTESLDLEAEGISSIIWCTGVAGDFSWLPESALDDRGQPIHENGVSPLPGLYYLGLPWLARRNSGILLGLGEDAERIVAAATTSPAR